MNQDFSNAVREYVEFSQRKWVEWKHIITGITHCPRCLSLDKCWFPVDNMPINPLHEMCHCTAKSISASTVKSRAKATSAYSKFDPYLFNTNGLYSHHKEDMFESWGYTVEDIPYLKAEIERQGREKYLYGDYSLGKLKVYFSIVPVKFLLKCFPKVIINVQ